MDSGQPSHILHQPAHPVRVVTAASLFDGHDASINIMRRILQAQGAEVIHLGHNRSVDEVVKAVVEEDAAAVAVSSYQGGHVEYFAYLVERLAAEGMGHVGVYGGGGGVISPDEIELLASTRRAHLLARPTASASGLAAMVNMILAENDRADPAPDRPRRPRAGVCPRPRPRAHRHRARHAARGPASPRCAPRRPPAPSPCSASPAPAARASRTLTDELVLRLRLDQEDKLRIAVLAVDPTRRRTGGALLGDRIRMNAIDGDRGVLPLGRPAVGDDRAAGLHRPADRRLQGRRRRPRRRRDARASARATPRSSTSPTSPST